MPTDLSLMRQSHDVIVAPDIVVQLVEYLIPLHVSSQPHIALPIMSWPAEQMPSPVHPYVALQFLSAVSAFLQAAGNSQEFVFWTKHAK